MVLVDTAGRQHTNENLIEEAKKIRRVVAPALTVFVGDALSGNDVLEQARLFDKEIGVDGLVLTKLDADTKGGAALSATYVTKKPILFVGVGQGYGDFRPFDPDWMVRRLFDGGDGGVTARVDVVLVRPKEDGNVGAVARARAQLRRGATRPRRPPRARSARKRADARWAGSRSSASARISVPSFARAIEDADLVVGTTDLSTGRSSAYLPPLGEPGAPRGDPRSGCSRARRGRLRTRGQRALPERARAVRPARSHPRAARVPDPQPLPRGRGRALRRSSCPRNHRPRDDARPAELLELNGTEKELFLARSGGPVDPDPATRRTNDGV